MHLLTRSSWKRRANKGTMLMFLGFPNLGWDSSISAYTIVIGVIETDFKKGSDNISGTSWEVEPFLVVVENRGDVINESGRGKE
jgi:hypothetical protein